MSIKKTRQVLDAFADRIGDFVWQTAITEEGLTAVKTLLAQTASKNTAVSCHRIKSRHRSELLWIVGSKSKFVHKAIRLSIFAKNQSNKNWNNKKEQ